MLKLGKTQLKHKKVKSKWMLEIRQILLRVHLARLLPVMILLHHHQLKQTQKQAPSPKTQHQSKSLNPTRNKAPKTK